MALTPIKLPQLQARIPIVDAKGMPTPAFVRYWNLDLLGALESALNAIIDNQNQTAALAADLAAQVARINAVVFANQQAAATAQAAAQAANTAQQTADEALANGTVSGSANDPAMSLAGTGWVAGPQVDLTSVLSGTLTINGTGPQQDLDVTLLTVPGTFAGEYRIVEIDGGIDTVVAGPFAFSATQSLGETVATVSNDAVSSVEAFSAARTTTGAISYRLDARRVSGANIDELYFYIYARRAA